MVLPCCTHQITKNPVNISISSPLKIQYPFLNIDIISRSSLCNIQKKSCYQYQQSVTAVVSDHTQCLFLKLLCGNGSCLPQECTGKLLLQLRLYFIGLWPNSPVRTFSNMSACVPAAECSLQMWAAHVKGSMGSHCFKWTWQGTLKKKETFSCNLAFDKSFFSALWDWAIARALASSVQLVPVESFEVFLASRILSLCCSWPAEVHAQQLWFNSKQHGLEKVEEPTYNIL